jgi:hypothetical protein
MIGKWHFCLRSICQVFLLINLSEPAAHDCNVKRYRRQVGYFLSKRDKDLKPVIDGMYLGGKASLTAPPRNEATEHNPKWPKSRQANLRNGEKQ